MYTLVLSVHVVLAIALVGLVLLQQGKGADVGAVMGGGGANTIFGVGGASSVLVRATTGIAILFMLTSVLLVKFSTGGTGRSAPADVLEGMDMKGLTPQGSGEQPAAGAPAQESKGSAASGSEATKPAEVPAAAPVAQPEKVDGDKK